MGTTHAGFRREGWQVYRREVGSFLRPARRRVLWVVAVLVGTSTAVGADVFFGSLDDPEWGGITRIAMDIGLASVAVGLASLVVIPVWWRRDRRDLPAVSWRDDRLVHDYSEPDAPELSAVLAPRLLGSARKQRCDGVGMLTTSLASFGAMIFGGACMVGLAAVSGYWNAGLLVGVFALINVPLQTARSLEVLGRTSVSMQLALALRAS